MKFEEKQIQLFKSIAKFVVLGGVFLWLLQEMIGLPFTAFKAYSVFILIADIIAMVSMLAFVGKMFIEKFAKILDSVFQIGIIFYVFFTAFAHIFTKTLFFTPNYAAIIVMCIITCALAVGLVFDTIKKRGMQFFDKFLLGVCILMLGVFDLVVGHFSRVGGMTFLPGSLEFFLLLFTVILMMLERYASFDEKVHDVMNLLLWNLAFFGLAIGATTWTGIIGIIADICVAVGAVVYVIMTYFKLKVMYGTETTTEETI